MNGIGQAFARAVVFAVIVAFISGGIFIAALIYLLPWLWQLAKPFLHTVTA